MQQARDFLKDKNIRPRLSLKDGKRHTIKILNAKADKLKNPDGSISEGLKLLIEEDGEMKTLFTSSIQFISVLSEMELGETIEIEMKKRLTDGGYKTYFDIKRLSDSGDSSEEMDIPIINPDEEEEENKF